MKPTLSILTPTILGREKQLHALQTRIEEQSSELKSLGQVEHLVFCDNRTRSIGAKRQALLDIARGQYIAFVDDDDDISDSYIAELLTAAGSGADVITFLQSATYNGQQSVVDFGINNQDEPFKPGGITLRAPWHICAWKRERVDECMFGESNYGEDRVWCLQARQRIKTGIHIPKILHFYRHDASTTAAPEPVR